MSTEPVNIDLDAERAARAETAGAAPTVTFGGKTFTLPLELSFDAAVAFQSGDVVDSCRKLIGDAYDEFAALKPSLQDMTVLVERVLPAYGMESGKSPGSPSSSGDAGVESKPTSSATMGSSSAKKSSKQAAAV